MNKTDDNNLLSQVEDGLDDLLIHQLYQTMRAFSKTLNNEIYTADVYSSEWSVLKMVKEHDMISQLELSNMLNVEPAAISKTIKKMEEKNLVERKRLQGKREKYIFLTNHALEIYDFLQEKVSQHRIKALKGLSQEERFALFKLMRRIYDNTLSEK
ncbi:MarR family transcriptional regulator [uncultured Megamonas sp.]|uniref:MarR family winged helix-turn-helix transcriptional regulator n=1 Tax=uncultured Megamonas sp. TaxID=286140 RepID=UPI0025D16811|nr:MarR family transcriptional regulator [uncultured Megamonas sp.]